MKGHAQHFIYRLYFIYARKIAYARENYVTVESALLLGYGFEPKIS